MAMSNKSIITFSGPSWSGKTTLATLLSSTLWGWYTFPENFTTRAKRWINDTEYTHISRKEFFDLLDQNTLIEIIHYDNNYYGIKNLLHNQTVMAVDVVALPQIIKHAMIHNYHHHSFYIDVSQDIIEKRMQWRGEDQSTIEIRKKNDTISALLWPKLCHTVLDGSWSAKEQLSLCLQQLDEKFFHEHQKDYKKDYIDALVTSIY